MFCLRKESWTKFLTYDEHSLYAIPNLTVPDDKKSQI